MPLLSLQPLHYSLTLVRYDFTGISAKMSCCGGNSGRQSPGDDRPPATLVTSEPAATPAEAMVDSTGSAEKAAASPSSMAPACIKAAEDQRLVVFVGAGTSMMPPTSLPSWTQINTAVLDALTARSKPSDDFDISKYRSAIQEGLSKNELPPEYFAEVLVNRLGAYYFNVLTVLNSATPNTVHNMLAELVKAGKCRAIVTTNFDLCLEAALTNSGLTPVVWKEDSEFDLGTVAAKFQEDNDNNSCLVLKLHGCASTATTVVDTLSQRSLGLGDNITDCLNELLVQGHWLFLGYSGADLAAAPNYLCLRHQLEVARGWTWLVRQGWDPLPAVSKLQEEYGDKAAIDFGELPQYLDPLLDDQAARDRAAQLKTGDAPASLEQRVTDWSLKLFVPEAAVATADLLVATKNLPLALELLEEVEKMSHGSTSRDEVAQAWVYNSIGNILSIQGQQERAIEYSKKSVDMLSAVQETLQGEAIKTSDVMIEDISTDHATLIRAKEIRARSLRDEGNATRTAVLTDTAFDDATALFKASLEAYEGLPPSSRATRGKALCEMGLGDVLRASTDPGDDTQVQATLAHYTTVIELAKTIGDLPMQALAMKNMGIVLKAKGSAPNVPEDQQAEALEKAFEQYKAAIDVQARIGDGLELVKSLRGLAGVYGDRKQWVDSAEYAEQSMKLAKKIGYQAGVARALRVLSEAAAGQGDYDKAADLIRDSLEINEALGDRSGVARGHFGIAKLLAKSGDKQKALKEAQTGIEIFEALGEQKHVRKIKAFIESSLASVEASTPAATFNDPKLVANLKEACATVRKAMVKVNELSPANSASEFNQMTRWVNTKEEHCVKIIRMILDVCLCQYVVPPGEDGSTFSSEEAYYDALKVHHNVLIKAMKAKQTKATEAADQLESAIDDASKMYATV